jgi:hypothetical protein
MATAEAVRKLNAPLPALSLPALSLSKGRRVKGSRGPNVAHGQAFPGRRWLGEVGSYVLILGQTRSGLQEDHRPRDHVHHVVGAHSMLPVSPGEYDRHGQAIEKSRRQESLQGSAMT